MGSFGSRPVERHFLGRRAFARGVAGAAAGLCLGCRDDPQVPHREASAMHPPSPTSAIRRMPVIFVGHGSPMNVLEDNRWSRGFAALGRTVPPPRAILAISAHWFVDGTLLTRAPRPRTIHDFGGFPRALYEIQYPAPGSPEVAGRVRDLLADAEAQLDDGWGLDHGTWSVLRWMYPEAAVPVIQLSIDRRLSPRRHFELGRHLAPLRDEGVLIMGSGNVTHNLRHAFTQMQTGSTQTPTWARSFDDAVERALTQRDTDGLVALGDTEDGRLAHPTPDHWWPMLYAYGATTDDDEPQFPVVGFDLGSLSMRNVVFEPRAT